MASQCGIRGYLHSGSYTTMGHSNTRKYRKLRVGLGDEIGIRRPKRQATVDTALMADSCWTWGPAGDCFPLVQEVASRSEDRT